jgi:hypothetical protein
LTAARERHYNRVEHVQLCGWEAEMDLTVVTYLAYLAVTVPLTIWVGRALARHGEVFLVAVFAGDTRLSHAVNQLLVIGFYLLNFGYLSYFMASEHAIAGGRDVMEVVSTKAGAVALVISLVHFADVGCLNAVRRRAVRRAQWSPAVPPTTTTTVVPPPPPAQPWVVPPAPMR